MSGKAKANMMGELGGELDWTDRLTDKDWSYYTGKEKGDRVVVFFDGIEVPAWEWWLEGLKSIGGKGPVNERSISSSSSTRSPELSPNTARPYRYSAADAAADDQMLLSEDLWGSDKPLRIDSPLSGRSPSRGRQVRSKEKDNSRSVSTPVRLSRNLAFDEKLSIPAQGPRAAYDPNRRLSTLSTATSDSGASTRAQSLSIHGYETSSPPTRHRSELRRKTGSPSLRTST